MKSEEASESLKPGMVESEKWCRSLTLEALVRQPVVEQVTDSIHRILEERCGGEHEHTDCRIDEWDHVEGRNEPGEFPNVGEVFERFSGGSGHGVTRFKVPQYSAAIKMLRPLHLPKNLNLRSKSRLLLSEMLGRQRRTIEGLGNIDATGIDHVICSTSAEDPSSYEYLDFQTRLPQSEISPLLAYITLSNWI